MKHIIIIFAIILLLCSCSVFNNSEESPNILPADIKNENIAPTNTSILETRTPNPTLSKTPTASPSPTPTPEPQLLLGHKIGIDPGHQNHENKEMESVSPYYYKEKKKVSLGTKGVASNVREYAFNLEISLLLKDALEKQGAEVYMTRTENAVNISNQERALMMNELKCDFWIRIHANYNDDDTKTGISTLTPKKGCVSTHIYETSKLLSGLIQKCVIEQTEAYDHGLSYRGNITGFNWSRIPVTLIECGYMSNADEDLLLQTNYYQTLLVNGIVEGMIQYLNGEEFPSEYEYVP